jgi:hypothetical protein
MSEETAWERAASEQGTTESERALTKLAKRAFLSLQFAVDADSGHSICRRLDGRSSKR